MLFWCSKTFLISKNANNSAAVYYFCGNGFIHFMIIEQHLFEIDFL